MEDDYLTLNDFNIPKTEVNADKISQFKSEEEHISLAVELLKEIGKITSILSCSSRFDHKNEPRKWTRNEAVLGGPMIRVTNLQKGLLDQICQDRLEIAVILLRCLMESLINLEYLLMKGDCAIDEYIEYSLRTEKKC